MLSGLGKHKNIISTPEGPESFFEYDHLQRESWANNNLLGVLR